MASLPWDLITAPEFGGRSGVSPYADFCMEIDHRVGQLLDALKAKGCDDNTLVIFTSDNGAAAGPSDCVTLEERVVNFTSDKIIPDCPGVRFLW
ncbi:MAG: sulfatase-like hydrolase/transferase [Opitutales bacterium]|nr:sulfatase-like hydrolase/transferase [Opitutales bacterium]